MKTCSKCGAERLESEFHVKDRKTGRRASTCRTCDGARAKQFYYDNRAERQEARREYARANRDKVNASERKWRRANREHMRQYGAAYRESHREELRAWARVYIQTPKQKAYRGRVRAEQHEALGRYIKNWRAENRGRMALYTHARRARMQGNGGSYTSEEWAALKAHYDFRCLCCGRREPDAKLTIDHVVPLALGGRNDISNLQPLCKSCNSRKRAHHIDYRPDCAIMRA